MEMMRGKRLAFSELGVRLLLRRKRMATGRIMKIQAS
jgi:hypothetical protein